MKSNYLKKSFVLLIIALAITLVLTVTALAADEVGATEGLTKSDGMDFLNNNRDLHVSKDIEEFPRTYEAVIYLPTDTSGEGAIFGNYLNLQLSHINFSINSAGQPKIYVHDTNVKNERQTTISFNKDVRGAWAHVVITHETATDGDVFKCYVNGEYVDEKTSSVSYSDVDMNKLQSATSFHIGRDFRPSGKGYFFKGRINDFALYNRALSAEEILDNYNSGIKKTEESLILYYDFETTDGKSNVSDASGNGHDAKSVFFERENEPSDYAYSFAILGDTQFLVNYDTVNSTSYAKDIFDWILANKDKYSIKRVLGVGDITETPKIDTNGDGVKDTIDEAQELKEWIYAEKLYDMLTDAGLPYSVTWGLGHDRPAKFDEHFMGKSNFTNSEIGYYSGTSLRNYYQRFTVGQTNYMIMSLEFTPDAPVLEWANGIINANPSDKVIILTHYYLEIDGALSSDTQPIFNTLVDNNPNVFMTLSGHVNYPSNIVRRRTVCNAGHTVTELLINPQYMDKEYGYNKTGMVAMLYFSEDGEDVKVEYISTSQTKNSTTDVLYGGTNQFSFSSIESTKTNITKYGTIPGEYSNASKYPFVIFDSNKKFVGASGYLYESTSSKTGAIYLAKEHIKTNFFNGKSYTGDVLSVVILMRRDVEMSSGESFNNLSQIKGTLTLDLGGYTLSAQNANDKYLFPSEMKAWTGSGAGDEPIFPTEIQVNNGKINTYYKPLIQFKPNANAPGKVFNYVFSDVKFFVRGSTTEFAITHASKDTVALYPCVTFNDCDIDITGATATDITLFNLGNSNTNASVYMNGGSIIAGNKSFSMTSKASGDGKLTFGKSEGAYTTLKIDSTANAPEDEYGELVFVKASLDSENGNYILMPKTIADFTPKTSITLDASLTLNVYVPKLDKLTSFTLDGKEYNNFTTLTVKDGDYIVSVALNASESARDISFVATFGDEGSKSYTFSSPEYAEKLLADNSVGDTEKALVKDALAYIRSAYNYFGTADADALAKINTLLAGYNNEFSGVSGTTTSFTVPDGATLVLRSTPAIRFYFTNEADRDAYSYKVGGSPVTFTKGSEVISDSTFYYADISLYAYRMIDTVDVYNGSTKVGSFNVGAYYEYVSGNSYTGADKTKLVDLVEKFYTYCKSADEYRNEVVAK